MKKEFTLSPYFVQEEPQIPVIGLIADLDKSPSYKLDAIAVYKAKGHGYLVVHVSGCSCWPYYGGTDQRVCNNKTDVQRAIREFSSYNDFADLLDMLQDRQWKIQKGE